MRNAKETRRAADFGEYQHGGRETAAKCHPDKYIRLRAKREEERARSYWRAVYGAHAEAASRGGIGWFSMRRGARHGK